MPHTRTSKISSTIPTRADVSTVSMSGLPFTALDVSELDQVASKVSRMLLPSQPGDVRNKEGGGRKAREGKGKKEDTRSTHEAKGAMEMKVVGKRKARDEKKGKGGTAVRKKATAEAGAGEVAAN